MLSHRAILDLWPSHSQITNDLEGKGVKITAGAVAMWRQREDIPAHYWPFLVEIAAEKGLALTLEELAGSQKSVRELRREAGA
jgi:hypothetical protein